MDDIAGEGGRAHIDVLGAAFAGRRESHPLEGLHVKRLAGFDIDGATFVLHADHSFDDVPVLVVFAVLRGPFPSGGRAYGRDGDP